MAYQEVFQWLVDIGLVDVVLPFILVFTLTFGVLQKTKVLGEEDKKPKRKLNAMVAFVMGFFAVLATNLLNVINTIVGYLVLLLIIGLLLALVLGLAGAEGGHTNKLFIAVMIVLFALFVFYALARAGVIDEQRFFSTILWPVIAIGVVAAVLYFVLRKKPAAPSRPRQGEGAPQTQASERGRRVPASEVQSRGEVEL